MKEKPDTSAPIVRVAVYTRKSTDEGLDQEFNSLDAQRQAVLAFVESQRGEGWTALPERYDDGGYTGANTDRPAFQRLLADVQANRVDCIAVYKLDRLSRSLSDFVATMGLLEKHGVAFCSVTQSFNTRTSMGRFVMNLLATFSEFEREVISERTSDKMRAARRRGLWTGGYVPLGYDVVDKKLVVNEAEAERVRAILGLYLECGSLPATIDELRRRGWTTKTWTNQDGKVVTGRAFDKGTLRTLLTNPLLLGKQRLGRETFDGAHQPIVDQKLFDAVVRQLRDNRRPPRRPRRGGWNAMLAGLIRCSRCASAWGHVSTRRGGRNWRYYACQKLQKEGSKACPGSRAPAADLEAFVTERIREIGKDPAVLKATVAAAREQVAARRPEIEADRQRLAARCRELNAERRNLVLAIGKGDARMVRPKASDPDDGTNGAIGAGTPSPSPSLAARLAEVDAEVEQARAAERAAAAEVEALDAGTIDEDDLRAAITAFDGIWSELHPRERARILSLLIEEIRCDAQAGQVEITFRPNGVKSLVQLDARRTA